MSGDELTALLEPFEPDATLTLIGRKRGSSSSRRQRKFRADRTVAAVARWRREHFDGFWLYDGDRCVAQWSDSEQRAAQFPPAPSPPAFRGRLEP